MENGADEISPQQSLQLIESMIAKTKADLRENRFYFLLWGWTSFVAILLQFALKVVLHYKHHYIVWILTLVAGVITIVGAQKDSKRAKVRTYVGESMGELWKGVGISFFILSFIITVGIGWVNAWPFMILMYGLGTFISGKFLQFKPLVAGGIISWTLAAASVFVSYNSQLLFAAAIFISYLLPMYIMPPNTNE
jgi:hypothetical protein